jgi:hypothetical protein
MRWVVGLTVAISGVTLTRLLLSQIRQLLGEMAGLVRAWHDVLQAHRETGATQPAGAVGRVAPAQKTALTKAPPAEGGALRRRAR